MMSSISAEQFFKMLIYGKLTLCLQHHSGTNRTSYVESISLLNMLILPQSVPDEKNAVISLLKCKEEKDRSLIAA